MKVMNITNFKKSYSESFDKVIEDHEPLLITRRNGCNSVLISEEDYNELEDRLKIITQA